jgi:hypothetical protein
MKRIMSDHYVFMKVLVLSNLKRLPDCYVLKTEMKWYEY